MQWYIALWRDAAFRTNTSTRFASLRASAWADTWFSDEVKAQAAAIKPAALRSYTRWSAAIANDKVPLPPPGGADYSASFDAGVAYLHDWLLNRLKWLDSQLLAGSAQQAAGSNATGGVNKTGSSSGSAEAAGPAGVPSQSKPSPLAVTG